MLKNIYLHAFCRYLLKDVTWNADYEETRPDSKGIRKLNYLRLNQKLGSTTVSIYYIYRGCSEEISFNTNYS